MCSSGDRYRRLLLTYCLHFCGIRRRRQVPPEHLYLSELYGITPHKPVISISITRHEGLMFHTKGNILCCTVQSNDRNFLHLGQGYTIFHCSRYHGTGFGNIWGYYKYKLRIIKIQFMFLFLTAVNITFYIPFNLSGSLSLSLSLSISHTRTRAHTNTHTHVNTSFFARRELISVTVTLAEKYYSTTNLHWNESCVTFKYNEQRLFFFLLV